MLQELFNEKQETVFDTKLSKAADSFCKACQEVEGWKRKKMSTEKDLIVEMHRTKQAILNLPDNQQIRIAVSQMKEKIVFKDMKVKNKRLRRKI